VADRQLKELAGGFSIVLQHDCDSPAASMVKRSILLYHSRFYRLFLK